MVHEKAVSIYGIDSWFSPSMLDNATAYSHIGNDHFESSSSFLRFYPQAVYGGAGLIHEHRAASEQLQTIWARHLDIAGDRA
jgi:hypothetical protein